MRVTRSVAFVVMFAVLAGLFGFASPAQAATPTAVSTDVDVVPWTSAIDAAGMPIATIMTLTGLHSSAKVGTTASPSPSPTPRPITRWVDSGKRTDYLPYYNGQVRYGVNGVPWTDPNTGLSTWNWYDRAPSGFPAENPAGQCGYTGRTFVNNVSQVLACVGSAGWTFNCMAIADGPWTDPMTNWSYGVRWNVDYKRVILKEQVSLDNGVTWSDTDNERRGGLSSGDYQVRWGDCLFYAGPVAQTKECMTDIGPVRWSGPVQSKGLPARYAPNSNDIIEVTKFQGPNIVRKADGSTWTEVTPLGASYDRNGGKLEGKGQVAASLYLVDNCADVQLKLPTPLQLPGWGNYKFEMDEKYVVCTIITQAEYNTRNFQGCGPKTPELVVKYAVKYCSNPVFAWMSSPDTTTNFDPSECSPNPVCTWENGNGKPLTTMEPYTDVPIALNNQGRAGTPAVVESDGRTIRIDLPRLEQTVNPPPPAVVSAVCPAGTVRQLNGMCRMFSDYTRSYGIKSYGASGMGTCDYMWSYWDGTKMVIEGIGSVNCLREGVPNYDWIKDPTPVGWRDNGKQWYRDIPPQKPEPVRWTVWEVDEGNQPWAPGGASETPNPNEEKQPFSGEINGQRKLAVINNDITLPKDGLPNTLGWDETGADVLDLQFFRPASSTNGGKFMVRAHFTQQWTEEFVMSSVAALGRYTAAYGPARTETFIIPETCTIPWQNFRAINARTVG